MPPHPAACGRVRTHAACGRVRTHAANGEKPHSKCYGQTLYFRLAFFKTLWRRYRPAARRAIKIRDKRGFTAQVLRHEAQRSARRSDKKRQPSLRLQTGLAFYWISLGYAIERI
jgi:hypothetical protein